jgi:LCP family protein required for cell wall assembly
MSYLEKRSRNNSFERSSDARKKFWKKRWFKIAAPIALVVLIVGGFFAWKTNSFLNKISSGGLLAAVVHSLPGADNMLKGQKEGRINIVVMGMRGATDPNGGMLSDSIEVVSIEPQADKISMISLPRDLYVYNLASGTQTKLNAVYEFGEKKGKGQGIKYMEQEVQNITGQPIQYGVVVNYNAFEKIIDTIGGVQITLDKPFEESVQFDQPHPCDSFFSVPTGQTQTKTKQYYSKETGIYKTRVVASYPMCTAPQDTLECGGDFKLPAGTQTLTAAQALCYVRSRETSNDFARAARQQQIAQGIKDRLLTLGTLANFSKVNSIIDSLGDNVQTDMQSWEIQSFYNLYTQMKGYTLYTRVIDASNDPNVGLVVGKSGTPAGDILLPKTGNYDQFKALFANIFTMNPQEKENPGDASSSGANLPASTPAAAPSASSAPVSTATPSTSTPSSTSTPAN